MDGLRVHNGLDEGSHTGLGAAGSISCSEIVEIEPDNSQHSLLVKGRRITLIQSNPEKLASEHQKCMGQSEKRRSSNPGKIHFKCWSYCANSS
ncbi:hypothetical protein PoB_000111400 [Plakobranchus ocellatus]|uniref:Uncharacterized protein n=1 Tax=Plakobranchus ocellatus TaxID=259542 RepID=A0AAV3XUS5_9GAST|nr:hypothetical protein PoB_000111400 [Plakobranchus ocellatus]